MQNKFLRMLSGFWVVLSLIACSPLNSPKPEALQNDTDVADQPIILSPTKILTATRTPTPAPTLTITASQTPTIIPTPLHSAHMGWNPGFENGIPDVPVVANVKEFGAVGDGVTDDAFAFKQAIDAVNSGAILITQPLFCKIGLMTF